MQMGSTHLVAHTNDVLAVETLQDGARLVSHADDLDVLRAGLAQTRADHFGHTGVNGAAQTWREEGGDKFISSLVMQPRVKNQSPVYF